MADLNPWEEAAPASNAVPLEQNPWEEAVGVPTPGPNLAGQIPGYESQGAPIAPGSWNPLTMSNAKQALADIIRGGLSTTTLLDRATNTMPSFVGPPNPNKPNLSTQVEPWLQKTFGQPDTSTAGRIGNFAATLAGGAIDPALLAGRALGGIGSLAGPAANSVRNGIFSNAQDLGYVLPPNYVGAGAGSRALGYLSGNDTLAAQMAARNQGITNTVSKQVAGISQTANLTHDVLTNRATAIANQTYEPLRNLGTITNGSVYRNDLRDAMRSYVDAEASIPGTGDPRILHLWQQYQVPSFDTRGITQTLTNLRNDATQAFRNGDTGLGNARRGIAQAIENSIQMNLQNPNSGVAQRLMASGNNSADMLNNYVAGRRQLAQTYAVRDALTGEGNVDPQQLANNMNGSWTGNLRTMGEFANAAPTLSKFTTVPPKTLIGTTTPELAALTSPITSLMMGKNFGAAPYVLAAGAAGRALTRQAMMTKLYQQMFVHPTTSILQQPGVQNAVPAFIQNSGLFGQQQ